jgi:hypothetical protein
VTPDGLKDLHGKPLEALSQRSRSHSESHCDFFQFKQEKELAMGSLSITDRKISELRPYPRNARTHSRKQIKQIKASIEEFGFTNPILIDENDQIMAGHGRVEAAKLLGLAEIPTVQIGHLSAAQKKAYILADNRLAELAGWDKEILTVEYRAYRQRVLTSSSRALRRRNLIFFLTLRRTKNPTVTAMTIFQRPGRPCPKRATSGC